MNVSSRFKRLTLSLGLALSFVLLAAGPMWAAQPERDLLRLVGADVGLCVELTDLRQHMGRLEGSPLLKRLQALSLYERWRTGPEHRKLAETAHAIQAATGQ